MLQQLFRPKSRENGIVTGVYAKHGEAEKSQQWLFPCLGWLIESNVLFLGWDGPDSRDIFAKTIWRMESGSNCSQWVARARRENPIRCSQVVIALLARKACACQAILKASRTRRTMGQWNRRQCYALPRVPRACVTSATGWIFCVALRNTANSAEALPGTFGDSLGPRSTYPDCATV
jgi:hypothetical protein